MELPTWDKPAFACLASRFPYGQRLTAEGLARVDEAEQYLRSLGFGQLRVRVHGNLARIEVLPEEREKLLAGDLADTVQARLRAMGFAYVTADLGGYRMGSMNRELDI